ncbi:hypothetical protein TELCIR_07533 [Teladorsagia circumcincta]|uniref:Uncharacterized protein n=1 Tax=Teladorsagia circumcincta TaxID=45464 RepID=A0A2G9UKD3_TELCI|nr:hypothetical protein TELCIR_07533 [Teladorsagia circumcincta]
MEVLNNNNNVEKIMEGEIEEPQSHDPLRRTINPRSYDDLLMVADSIRSQLGSKADVEVGIICGSGLGPIGDQVEDPVVLPYEKIPGFPSVKGEISCFCPYRKLSQPISNSGPFRVKEKRLHVVHKMTNRFAD